MSEKNNFSESEKKVKKVQPSEKYSNYDMDNSYFVTSGEKWAFSDSFFCSEGGFFLPVSIFRSRTIFFSRGTREKNSSRERNGYREEKTLPKNRKKEYEKQAHFRNEGQKVLYSIVVYNEGFVFIRKSLFKILKLNKIPQVK